MKRRMAIVLATGLAAVGCEYRVESAVQEPVGVTASKPGRSPGRLAGPALADKYRACIALINEARFADFRKECVEAGYTVHAVAGATELQGVDSVIEALRARKSAMPDWKLQPQLVMISGRTILAVNLVTGTHTGTLMTPTGPAPATHRKVGQLIFHRLAVSDADKATDEWAYADAATVLAQLGIAPRGTPAKRPAVDKGWNGAPIVRVSAGDAKEIAHLELVARINDAFVENRLAELMAAYSDDIADMNQRSDKDVKGKKAIEEGFLAFRNTWGSVAVSNEGVWAAGDYVVHSFTLEAKSKKTGQSVSFDAAQVMHVKDGKIDRLWAF